MTLAIQTTGLTRLFGDRAAVDGIDLSVPAGTIHGLLGPNGAGKTTTVRMLATLLTPTAGTALVHGVDVAADPAGVRSRISLTGQYAAVDEDLTGSENLALVARLLGHRRSAARRRAAELLDAFGLGDAADRQVSRYSGGMRRRLDIAASIVVSPELLFLDEPTTGLDPRSRGPGWDVVRVLVDAGTTVLLTTQYLEEADRLADRISVIDAGRVVAEGTPESLKASVGSGSLRVHVADPGQLDEARRALGAALAAPVTAGPSADALLVGTSDPRDAARALRALDDAGVDVSDLAVARPTLDEAFLTLTDTTAGATA